MKYIFSEANQSPWIVDVYNFYMPYKQDGVLVEIGVGHTINGVDIFNDLIRIKEHGSFNRAGSNTADLLDLGWQGIYIEPIIEFCEEAAYCHKDKLNRLKIVCAAASDEEKDETLFIGESFKPTGLSGTRDYVGRTIKTQVTSNILKQYDCPKNIDIMSIDVEGFEDKVIKGIDFNLHLPTIMVIEINQISTQIIDNILPQQYKLVQTDGLNAAWVLH